AVEGRVDVHAGHGGVDRGDLQRALGDVAGTYLDVREVPADHLGQERETLDRYVWLRRETLVLDLRRHDALGQRPAAEVQADQHDEDRQHHDRERSEPAAATRPYDAVLAVVGRRRLAVLVHGRSPPVLVHGRLPTSTACSWPE